MEIFYEDKCPHVPDNELIDDLKRTIQSLQKDTLTLAEYDRYGKYNSSTITRRFGSWNKALSLAGINISNKFHTDQMVLLQMRFIRVFECLPILDPKIALVNITDRF